MGHTPQQQAKPGDPSAKPGTTAETRSVALAPPGALEIQRAEIRNQLRELRTRRNELLEQRALVDEPQRKLLDVRIANINERSAQLETQLFSLNDQIAQAGPAGGLLVDQSTTVPPRDVDPDLRIPLQDAVYEAVGISTMSVLSVYVLWRGFRRYIWKAQPAPALRDYSAQMNQLQQSMDVIALEVERISEAQRYTAKLLSEKGEKVPAIKG